MDKEEFLKSVVGLYNEATDKAIREIAEKAICPAHQTPQTLLLAEFFDEWR